MSTIEKAMRRLTGAPEPTPEPALSEDALPNEMVAPAVSVTLEPVQQLAESPALRLPQSSSASQPRSEGLDLRPQLNIDFERLRHLGFLTPGDPTSRLSEEFQEIKRKLIAQSQSHVA